MKSDDHGEGQFDWLIREPETEAERLRQEVFRLEAELREAQLEAAMGPDAATDRLFRDGLKVYLQHPDESEKAEKAPETGKVYKVTEPRERDAGIQGGTWYYLDSAVLKEYERILNAKQGEIDMLQQEKENLAARVDTNAGNLLARVQELESILRSLQSLFSRIGMDWSDPRSECNEGLRVIQEALKNKELGA